MAGFDAGNVDETIHGRLRLGIMAYLTSVSPAPFTELAHVLEATNGNLSVHLRKLEEAGYVTTEKGFESRRPLTLVHLTDKGREAWASYLEALKPLFPDL
ncbi:transcriptional regulator [Parvularcula sp. LCG005]|uniref:winged helix-turn-helix domain-containing protein n=1 Tax=Parvularcula sp. LCG005 TaxID=3078805 RepID=UPI00294239A6|nr:transcriptional regulator [Parvularcula sp. LCG005]WOI53161.1 transcriptional regulator [Parvularcula sp. LCG005]